MNLVHRIEFWGDTHHPRVLDIIRMLLGILLVAKGVDFFEHMAYLRDLVVENKSISQSPELVTAIIYYVTYVHLVGGVLIFLGLFTRLASIFQLPIVLGAVFFINILTSFVNSELWLSIIALGLLVLFIIIGSGLLSLTGFLTDFNKDNDAIADL